MEIPDVITDKDYVLTDQDVGLPFIPTVLISSRTPLLCPYTEITDVINIKPISRNAHIDQDVGPPFMPIAYMEIPEIPCICVSITQ